MIKHLNLFNIILCCILFIACSDNKESNSETIFQEQVDALDKAHTVEDTLFKANQQQRETIDTQSR